MTKQSLGHLPFLDLLRGCSVFFVFCYHALAEAFTPHDIPWDGLFRDFGASGSLLVSIPLQFGWIGVASFFVVSGFCVHLSWLRSRDDGWTVFLGRRFLRIYPPYLAAFLAVAATCLAGVCHDELNPSLANFLAHLTLVHNFHPSTIYSYAVSFWSIAVEFQLYALFPLVMLARSRWGWGGTLVLVAAMEVGLRLGASASLLGGWTFPSTLLDTPLAYWFSWSLGAFLADNLSEGRTSVLDRVPAWPWLLAVLASFFLHPLEPLDFTFASLATYALLGRIVRAGGFAPESKLARIWADHATKVGVVSFSVYLFHEPILKLGMSAFDLVLGPGAHPLLRLALCFCFWPVSVAAGNLSYKWLEAPSIALGRTFARTVAARRQAAARGA